MGGEYVNVGGVAQLIGGAGDASKILDETFDTDFSAFSAPDAAWGINTTLPSDFSISGGVGRIGSTSERGLLLPVTVKNSLQIATVRAGSTDSANRFRLKSRVIPGEATAAEINWIAATSSGSFRITLLDDGAPSSVNSATKNSVVGSYYALVMLTLGEVVMAFIVQLDATGKDLRGEYADGHGGSTPINTGANDASTGWPAELNADQAGGGFMLSAGGPQNTGATPSELLRWEIWDLGD